MEFVLLAKVGMAIKVIVYAGYAMAGGYVLKTGHQYVRDYKESMANEGK